MYRFDAAAYNARVDWFRKARFGMFIHWGLYSIPGRGEWVRSIEQMPEKDTCPISKPSLPGILIPLPGPKLPKPPECAMW